MNASRGGEEHGDGWRRYQEKTYIERRGLASVKTRWEWMDEVKRQKAEIPMRCSVLMFSSEQWELPRLLGP